MKITEDQLRDEGTLNVRDDMGPSARRTAGGMHPGPREYTDDQLGIQSPPVRGRTDNSIVTDPEAMRLQADNAGLPFGVSGTHGETGDPIARDITGSIAAGPMLRMMMAASRFAIPSGIARFLPAPSAVPSYPLRTGIGATAAVEAIPRRTNR